jgi:hypothetical protein
MVTSDTVAEKRIFDNRCKLFVRKIRISQNGLHSSLSKVDHYVGHTILA